MTGVASLCFLISNFLVLSFIHRITTNNSPSAIIILPHSRFFT